MRALALPTWTRHLTQEVHGEHRNVTQISTKMWLTHVVWSRGVVLDAFMLKCTVIQSGFMEITSVNECCRGHQICHQSSVLPLAKLEPDPGISSSTVGPEKKVSGPSQDEFVEYTIYNTETQ